MEEDAVFELHLKQWVGAGQAGKEQVEEVFPGTRKTRSKGVEA